MEMKKITQRVERWIFGDYIDLLKIKSLEESGIKPVF